MNRNVVTAALAAALGSSVVAEAAPQAHVRGLVPLPRDLPARCAPLAVLPVAQIATPELSAHISVANCLAEVALGNLTVAPDAASVARVDAAVAPSFAILDNLIRVGDPYWRMLAQDAKRDLYLGMVVRERDSLTGVGIEAHAGLEALLVPWQLGEGKAMVAMTELARDNARLARRDAVISGVIARLPEERAGHFAVARQAAPLRR